MVKLWSVSCRALVVCQNRRTSMSRMAEQPKYGRKCFWLERQSRQTSCERGPKSVKLIYLCLLSSLFVTALSPASSLSFSPLICISLYLFLDFSCLPPTLLVIPASLPLSFSLYKLFFIWLGTKLGVLWTNLSPFWKGINLCVLEELSRSVCTHKYEHRLITE